MNQRHALILGATGLLALGALHQAKAAPSAAQPAVTATRLAHPPQEPGFLPDTWLAGNDCSSEGEFQVHAYNRDFYIIRQSKCAIFEAPFLYLIFGQDYALLMDTGANPNTDVSGVVQRIIRDWSDDNGVPLHPLVVAHTHGHFDHTQGDSQFVGQPNVLQVVGTGAQDAISFWGFQDWPNDVQTIDLGDRVLDVLATPGHAPGSVTLYDRRTQLLLTGDIVYPGHLFIFSASHWDFFKNSLRRLVLFARDNPVEWVLGCHIEMGAAPFDSYAYGTTAHPDEHVLEFRPSKLVEIYSAAQMMGNTPQCQIFDEFVIHPVYLCGITWNG